MEFNGRFELEDVTMEEVWLALSDPYMIKNALPGCQFLLEVEDDNPDFEALREQSEAAGEDPPILPEADPEVVADRTLGQGETWAALMEISVGAVKPSFETVVTVVEREFPTMTAEGEGSASSSSFEMQAGMTLEETDGGVAVDWWAEADVFGRIAQMGQRVINPVANRVVNRFFSSIESQLSDVGEDESGLRERIRDLI